MGGSMHSSHNDRNIHNIAVLGKDGVGKSKLVKTLLQIQTKSDEVNIIETPEEKARSYTIFNKFYHFDTGDEAVNLMDTPGNTNFLASINVAVYASTCAVFVTSPAGGSESALRIWEAIEKYNKPRAIFVNMLDEDEGKLEDALQSIEDSFSVKPAVLYIPWYNGDKLGGVIDIINIKLFKEEAGKITIEDVPTDAMDEVELYRSATYERLAEMDDELMEFYIEEKPAPDELLVKVLSAGVKSCEITPVLVGSALENIGVSTLYDFIKTNFPSFSSGPIWKGKASKEEEAEPVERAPSKDEPFAGQVFKTAYDRYIGKLSYMLVTSGVFTKGMKLHNSSIGRKVQTGRFYVMNADKPDELEEAVPGDIVVLEKMDDIETNHTICDSENLIVLDPIKFHNPMYSNRLEMTNSSKDGRTMDAINKVLQEDPTLSLKFNNETKEMVLYGMGLLHIDVTKEYLNNLYDVEVNLAPSTIGYLETVRGKATVQGKYKKQSGGHGQYGDVHIILESNPGKGFEFVDKIVGGSVPRNYIPGVEKGVVESLDTGILAGYPVVDVKVTLFDGTYHAVDSSDFAFQRAGSMAVKKALPEAKPVILEPIMEVEIDVLEADVGKIAKDLSGRRGKVSSYSYGKLTTVIHAEVPLGELMDYTPTLRGLTVGLGLYDMKLKSYEVLASTLAEKVIASRSKSEE